MDTTVMQHSETTDAAQTFDILDTVNPGFLITPKNAKTKAEMQLAMEAELAIENSGDMFENMKSMR